MSAFWYSLADIPKTTVHANVWWMAHGTPRCIDGVARIYERRQNVWRWYRIADDGAIEMLPKSGGQWGDEPVCWQPANPRFTWPGGIEPAPLAPHMVPRIESVSNWKLTAILDADVADLAREMEQDREAARAQGRRPDQDDRDARPTSRWWLDLSNIRYEPPGQITKKMCEGRLLRALANAGPMRDRLRGMTVASLLAQLVDERSANESNSDRLASDYFIRFQPLRSDESDFLIAMAWFTALKTPEMAARQTDPMAPTRRQSVVWMRAWDRPLSFWDIAQELSKGMSWQNAQRLYDDAITACHRVANGQSAYRVYRIIGDTPRAHMKVRKKIAP